jgi:hypothetical protein
LYILPQNYCFFYPAINTILSDDPKRQTSSDVKIAKKSALIGEKSKEPSLNSKDRRVKDVKNSV